MAHKKSATSLSEVFIRKWGTRKLKPLTKTEKQAIDAINHDFLEAANEAATAAHCPDTAWLISLWTSPLDL